MVCAQGRGCSQYGLHYLSSCSISRSHETRAISPRQICLQLRAGGGGKYGHRGTIRRSRATILAILLIETNDADIGRRLYIYTLYQGVKWNIYNLHKCLFWKWKIEEREVVEELDQIRRYASANLRITHIVSFRSWHRLIKYTTQNVFSTFFTIRGLLLATEINLGLSGAAAWINSVCTCNCQDAGVQTIIANISRLYLFLKYQSQLKSHVMKARLLKLLPEKDISSPNRHSSWFGLVKARLLLLQIL